VNGAALSIPHLRHPAPESQTERVAEPVQTLSMVEGVGCRGKTGCKTLSITNPVIPSVVEESLLQDKDVPR
jgi:hypothetical protein